jgi:glycerol uptake operon antiterminator
MQSGVSLLNLPAASLLVPVVETRPRFVQALETPTVRAILLRHCNVFEFTTLAERAHRSGYALYVNMDHIDGIHADRAGLRYLAERLSIRGIVSSHPRVVALAHDMGLEAIQRIFAVDSTGLEMALESVEVADVDMLDIAPAHAVPYVLPLLRPTLTLPYMASGLLYGAEQLRAVLACGVRALAVTRLDQWIAILNARRPSAETRS